MAVRVSSLLLVLFVVVNSAVHSVQAVRLDAVLKRSSSTHRNIDLSAMAPNLASPPAGEQGLNPQTIETHHVVPGGPSIAEMQQKAVQAKDDMPAAGMLTGADPRGLTVPMAVGATSEHNPFAKTVPYNPTGHGEQMRVDEPLPGRPESGLAVVAAASTSEEAINGWIEKMTGAGGAGGAGGATFLETDARMTNRVGEKADAASASAEAKEVAAAEKATDSAIAAHAGAEAATPETQTAAAALKAITAPAYARPADKGPVATWGYNTGRFGYYPGNAGLWGGYPFPYTGWQAAGQVFHTSNLPGYQTTAHPSYPATHVSAGPIYGWDSLPQPKDLELPTEWHKMFIPFTPNTPVTGDPTQEVPDAALGSAWPAQLAEDFRDAAYLTHSKDLLMQREEQTDDGSGLTGDGINPVTGKTPAGLPPPPVFGGMVATADLQDVNTKVPLPVSKDGAIKLPGLLCHKVKKQVGKIGQYQEGLECEPSAEQLGLGLRALRKATQLPQDNFDTGGGLMGQYYQDWFHPRPGASRHADIQQFDYISPVVTSLKPEDLVHSQTSGNDDMGMSSYDKDMALNFLEEQAQTQTQTQTQGQTQAQTDGQGQGQAATQTGTGATVNLAAMLPPPTTWFLPTGREETPFQNEVDPVLEYNPYNPYAVNREQDLEPGQRVMRNRLGAALPPNMPNERGVATGPGIKPADLPETV